MKSAACVCVPAQSVVCNLVSYTTAVRSFYFIHIWPFTIICLVLLMMSFSCSSTETVTKQHATPTDFLLQHSQYTFHVNQTLNIVQTFQFSPRRNGLKVLCVFIRGGGEEEGETESERCALSSGVWNDNCANTPICRWRKWFNNTSDFPGSDYAQIEYERNNDPGDDSVSRRFTRHYFWMILFYVLWCFDWHNVYGGFFLFVFLHSFQTWMESPENEFGAERRWNNGCRK